MTVTVDLSIDQVEQLKQLASATGRDTRDLVHEAINNLLAYNAWFKDQVQIGLDQADRGEFLEDAEVQAQIAQIFHS